MTCHDVRTHVAELLTQEHQPQPALCETHLRECPDCRAYLAQMRNVLRIIQPPLKITASNSFKERVMQQIYDEQTKPRTWNWFRPRWITAGLAAAGLLLLIPLLHIGGRHSTSPGAILLAQSVDALAKIQTVHLAGRIRTLPGDNFDLVGREYDFVPIEIWREYGIPSRWRIEKPGRVAVMDGASATLYISKTNSGVKAKSGYGFIEWLRPLLDPGSLLAGELTAARQEAAPMEINESNATTTLTIHRKAKGLFTNDWARNKSITEADHTAIYNFDAATKRLLSLKIDMSIDGQDTTIAEFSDIRYNEPVSAALFTLQLPADVNWASDPATMKGLAVTLTGPKDAAMYFFDSLAHERWDDILAVYPQTRVEDIVKQIYGGLEVISIGEPFQSGLYRGYFVPYQVKLRNGATKTHKLAVRNDNPQQRWLVDGGF